MSSSGSESGDDRSSEEEIEPTIASDVVVSKYMHAAEIANAVLAELVKRSVPGALILELCEYGDRTIMERTANTFKREKEMRRGIAFPTCVSVNNCVCHFSPLRSEAAAQVLNDGDLVKIDLGAHVDGFIAVAAHSLVVGASKDQKVTGRKADVIQAAHNCLEAAIRMLRPGQHKNVDITENLNKISEVFNCKPVENMLSFQLRRNQIGNEEVEDTKVIIQNPNEEQRGKVKKVEFGEYEVYAIDILISTGDGKGKEQDTRTTVYKKNEAVTYSLKMKMSRAFYSEAQKRFEPMPFTLRAFEDEKRSKMAIVECERHALLKPFKVYYERPGEFVAQFKSTVFVMPNGLLKITGLPFESEAYQFEFSVQDKDLRALIVSALKQKAIALIPSFAGLPFESEAYQSEFSVQDKDLRALIVSALKPKAKKKKAAKPASGDAALPAAPIPPPLQPVAT